jgi:septum site-determining protein MinC
LSQSGLPESFRLRAGNFSLLVLRLIDPRPEAVLPALGDQFRRAPGFLRFAPIVIGLGDLEAAPEQVDFRALIEGLHGLEIVPIGTIGGTPAMRQAAVAAGLPPLRAAGGKESEADPLAAPPTSPGAAPLAEAPPAPAAAIPLTVPSGARATLVVRDPVRSGQRVYAKGGDLIVTATVNAGGEVIADGNIHIYGALRGRAMAGVADDVEASIYALHFDPELVAIAGLYTAREGLGGAPLGRAVQVRLDGESMRFDPLGG